MIDAPNAVSAILKHSKIGSKINEDALNNLFHEELNKRKSMENDDTMESPSSKHLKTEETPAGGPRSLLSGLTLKY